MSSKIFRNWILLCLLIKTRYRHLKPFRPWTKVLPGRGLDNLSAQNMPPRQDIKDILGPSHMASLPIDKKAKMMAKLLRIIKGGMVRELLWRPL